MQTTHSPAIKSPEVRAYVKYLIADSQLKDNVITEKNDVVIDEQQKRIALLEKYLRLAKTQRFGQSSEKNPHQGELFDESELEADVEVLGSQFTEKKPVKKKAPDKALSSKLPRIRIRLNLTEEEKEGAINTFYTPVKEELDIIPVISNLRLLWYGINSYNGSAG